MQEIEAKSDEYMFFLKKVGEQLNRARVEKGLSQRALARVANKNHTIVTRVEKTPPLDLSLRSIYDLATHIPISMSELMSRAELDLHIKQARTEPEGKNDNRINMLFDKVRELSGEERAWIADVLDSLINKSEAKM